VTKATGYIAPNHLLLPVVFKTPENQQRQADGILVAVAVAESQPQFLLLLCTSATVLLPHQPMCAAANELLLTDNHCKVA
jgi:hypothetical protein